MTKKKSLEAVELESLEVPGLGLVTRGLKVVHPHFGSGTVVALFKFVRLGNHTIGVQFESVYGYKALDPEFARLRLPESQEKSQ